MTLLDKYFQFTILIFIKTGFFGQWLPPWISFHSFLQMLRKLDTRKYYISSHLSPLTSEVSGHHRWRCNNTVPPSRLPLPSGNLQTPFPSIPWCYLSISSSGFLRSLLLDPFTVPCRIVFAMPEDLEMWPYHLFPFLYHGALELHSGFYCEPLRS